MPLVIECRLEPVTHISRGLDLSCINEREEVLCLDANLAAHKDRVVPEDS